MAKPRVELRFDEDLLTRIDAAAGPGGRTAWILTACRESIEGGAANPAAGESLSPTDARDYAKLVMSQGLLTLVQYFASASVQKPSEARNLIGTMRDTARFAAEFELLDAIGDLTDDPEEIVEKLRLLVAEAKARVAGKPPAEVAPAE